MKAGSEARHRDLKVKRSRWRTWGIVLGILVVLLVAARLAMPSAIRWYVNRTLSRSPLYQGQIGDVQIHLWRGAYSIEDVKMLKRTGLAPEPLFATKRVDFSVQWDALLHGKVVGRVAMDEPALNFVQAKDDSNSQTGAGGPWLEMLRDLFPFEINRAEIHNGSVHFLSPDTDPPVNVYLSQMEASVDNLKNIQNSVTPQFATVKAEAMAMGNAKFQYQMKFDPFSYYPTFELAVRLVGLDVTKFNALTRAYGDFDFEQGWFDLVIEMTSHEGEVRGYVKPLFRNLRIVSLRKLLKEDNVIEAFWETLVGSVTHLLRNRSRDQFGTLIPLRGSIAQPRVSILETLGNVLRNAFIRAYLPKLQGTAPDIQGLQFDAGESVTEPLSTTRETNGPSS